MSRNGVMRLKDDAQEDDLRGVHAALSPVDRRLERAYRSLGPRLFLAYVAVGWLLLLGFGALAIAVFARTEELSGGDAVRLFALDFPIWLVGLVISLVGCDRRMRPILDVSRHAAAADALTAWQVARDLPVYAVRLSCVVAAGICGPPAVAAGASVIPLDVPIVLVLLICVAAAAALVASGGVFGAQLVARPIIRDLAGRLAASTPAGPRSSVGLKLRVAVPAVTVAMAALAVVVGAQPGTDHWTLLTGVLIATAVAFVIAMVIAQLLAISVVQPLDDLLQATRRLKSGDFGRPVPDLSADEYGVLARSFNEAMDGLAERQRLAAEVRESRARIVSASDAERRRIERNIHDGAQQRLVALALDLRMLAELANSRGADELQEMADAATESLIDALADLRELARGLHPSVLTTDGLSPAVMQLAVLAPLPVAVTVPNERFPENVESTAYFVACEALANVAKYADASRAEVAIATHNGHLRIDIRDNGVGGADPSSGSGLAGLADRVAALDGTLTIDSPVGGGTHIAAKLPLRSDAQ